MEHVSVSAMEDLSGGFIGSGTAFLHTDVLSSSRSGRSLRVEATS